MSCMSTSCHIMEDKTDAIAAKSFNEDFYIQRARQKINKDRQWSGIQAAMT